MSGNKPTGRKPGFNSSSEGFVSAPKVKPDAPTSNPIASSNPIAKNPNTDSDNLAIAWRKYVNSLSEMEEVAGVWIQFMNKENVPGKDEAEAKWHKAMAEAKQARRLFLDRKSPEESEEEFHNRLERAKQASEPRTQPSCTKCDDFGWYIDSNERGEPIQERCDCPLPYSIHNEVLDEYGNVAF